MEKTDICPCGSDKQLKECCEPIIQGIKKAETAEQLMRSRYTAFTFAANDYLLNSWARETRPETVRAEEGSIQWLNLQIEACEKGTAEDETGLVTFTASFLSSGHLCKLHEKSSFIKEKGLWYYLHGETDSRTEKVGRNAPCPCGSGKKYKRCCC
jgi:SEC-C motif-containing protein